MRIDRGEKRNTMCQEALFATRDTRANTSKNWVTVNQPKRYLELWIQVGRTRGSSWAAPRIWPQRADRRPQKFGLRRETCFRLQPRVSFRVGCALSGGPSALGAPGQDNAVQGGFALIFRRLMQAIRSVTRSQITSHARQVKVVGVSWLFIATQRAKSTNSIV